MCRTSAALSVLIRLEGAVVAALSIFIYRQFSWILFAVLFLAPDLSMLGYVANIRIGAAIYNFVHTFLAPGLLIAVAILAALAPCPDLDRTHRL